MKGTTTASLALIAICLAATPALRSQLPPPSGQPGHQPVELATPEKEASAVGQLVGKPVRGTNQEEFGTISDFLIEPQSGRVHFVIVTAGDKTFRLVPMSALQQGSGTDGLMVGLDRAQWDQIGTMTEQELLSRVTIDAAHQQRFQQQFRLSAGEQPAEGLLRATLMNERELRAAGGERIGTVNDVVIDFNNRTAALLVRPEAGFSPGDQRALVHFSRLQVSQDGQGPITASLGRSDFRQLRASPLTPTGYPGGFNQAQQPHHAAAMAVQQALERDTATRGTVQAVPETRIVLRGAVDTEQKKTEIEQAAQQAAPGVEIDNQLMVRNQ